MKRINFQNYVNMISALIVFIGGLMIIVMYPGGISMQYRVLIGLFVTLYFFLRMGQTILAIRRERRKGESELGGVGAGDDGQGSPKSP